MYFTRVSIEFLWGMVLVSFTGAHGGLTFIWQQLNQR